MDKRNKLYKAIKDIGTISEINGMNENNLKLWMTSILAKEDKKITEKTLMYFMNKTGTDMENCIQMEELIKTGRILDQIAVELLIVRYSRKQVMSNELGTLI